MSSAMNGDPERLPHIPEDERRWRGLSEELALGYGQFFQQRLHCKLIPEGSAGRTKRIPTDGRMPRQESLPLHQRYRFRRSCTYHPRLRDSRQSECSTVKTPCGALWLRCGPPEAGQDFPPFTQQETNKILWPSQLHYTGSGIMQKSL